jgi:hypothetical protein
MPVKKEELSILGKDDKPPVDNSRKATIDMNGSVDFHKTNQDHGH